MSSHVDRMVDGIRATVVTHECLEPTGETLTGVQAFVRYYTDLIHPLPIDPVALLVHYERYQSALAAEAAEIDWLSGAYGGRLKTLLADAVEDSAAIIGCNERAAADSMSLWTRGIIERKVR